jgi:hypothetical protein
MNDADVFVTVVSALQASGVSRMLTGSFAASIHGRVRSTRDIDFVIEADDEKIRKLVAALLERHFYVDEAAALEALRTNTQFNAIDPGTGWKIDFITRKPRAFSHEEFSRRTSVELNGVSIEVATAEDTIIAKLEWAKIGESERQIEDVVGILRMQLDHLDRDYIERWVESLGLRAEWNRANRLMRT